MARYTCSYTVNLSLEEIKNNLKDIFTNCNCNLLYDTADYFMARENQGKIHFSRLVTIEVLPDILKEPNHLRLDFVVKNEELPLQLNNHCHQIFNLLQQVIAENYQWELEQNLVNNTKREVSEVTIETRKSKDE